MNSVGKAINHILQNGTTELAAHPDFAKHDYGDTYITYRVSGITPFDTKDGPSDLDEIDVDVTIYSIDADTLLDLAEKVRNDLDRVAYGSYNGVGLGGVQFQGEDSDYNDITERYECEQRYIFRVSKSITHTPPGGSCDNATVTNSDDTFTASVASGGSLVLDDNQVTDIDGTTRDVPAQTDVVCEWTTIRVRNSNNSFIKEILDYASVVDLPDIDVTQVNGAVASVPSVQDVVCNWSTIFVVNSAETILAFADSYPTGNRINLLDIGVNEIDGTETTQPAGVDVTCQWFDITLKDQNGNVLGTINSFPTGGEYELTIEGGNVFNVSNSFQVNTQIRDDYYYGNTTYGWNYIIWGTRDADMASIFHTNANSGITVTGDYTSIIVKGIIQNQSNPSVTYTLGIWITPRPNGSSSSFSPTLLASQEVVCSVENNFYNFDLSGTDLTINDGDLLFFTVRRDTGDANQTNTTNVSLTIECT